ncbi:MAG: peptide-binding protein [Campylobacter sp.]|nr:peptide-binding protein [Campylobacter sp.]
MQLLKKELLKNENFILLSFIVIAFGFSVLCRFYWVFWASSFTQYFFNDELMIVSNDGYAFAEGARDMIAGFHQENDLSYYGSSLSSLTFWLYKITPWSFETIILYMSTFFSSLIVVPIILIAKEYKCPLMGFIAALIASIANSYYNRTMSGYYDTDMLAIVLPMFILFFMIRLILKKDFFSLIALPLFIGIYLWWYPSSYTLNVSLIGLFFLYTLIFHRNEKLFYIAVILSSLTLSNIAWFYQSAIIVILFAFFALKQNSFKFSFIITLGIVTLIFLIFSGGIDPILYQLRFYIFRADESANLAQGFAYFNVSKTIQETENIDLDVFMQRISTSVMVFVFSFLGFLWLLKEHKTMILALPMLFLGFLALKSGLRFTIYAVPIMALGFGFLSMKFLKEFKNLELKKLGNLRKIKLYCLVLLLGFIAFSLIEFLWNLSENDFVLEKVSYFKIFSDLYFENSLLFLLLILSIFTPFVLELLRKKQIKQAKITSMVAILLFALFFAFKHIYEYRVPTVFNHNEAALLNELKNKVSREDYIVAWWDYGYPIRYYSDVKTLADGGKHLGKDNFFPSFVLSKEQRAAANMARLSVEYTEKSFKTPYEDLLQAMMKDYNNSNVDLFLASLGKNDFKLKTPKTRDIYIYFPVRMTAIFPTVASFSYMSLENGELENTFTFSPAFYRGEDDGLIYLSNGILLSNDFRSFIFNDKIYPLHSLVEFNSIRQKDYKFIPIDESADFYLFYIKDTSASFQFILMDKTMFNSAFVQMFFLGNYDENLFELIVNSNEAKVFKLKI